MRILPSVSYRPPSHQPRGAWARHLHEQRKLRDLSQTQAFELVYERVGWSAKSRTAYVAIDMGERQPKENEAAVLGEEFGWPAEEGTPTEEPTLAAAITALVAELQASRLERESMESRLRAVEAELQSLRGPQATEGSPMRPVLRG
jgi:hypothetical protein